MSSEPTVLRPLSIPELFDEVFSLYRKNFLLFAGIVGLVYLPLSLVFGLWIQSMFAGNATTLQQAVASGLWLTLLGGFIDAISVAALTKAISERYLGQPINILTAYAFILRRFFPYLGTMLLVGLVTGGGFVLLVVPGVLFLFMFSLVNPVFVVEGLSFNLAMRRSRELAKGNWPKILLIFGLLYGLGWLAQLGAENLTPLLVGEGKTPTSIFVEAFLELLLSMGLQPVGLCAFVLLYFDIRVRTEGYDLERLAKEMGAGTGSPSMVAEL